MTEDYILNELSLVKGWQYRHAILRSYNVETHFIKDADDILDNLELLNEVRFVAESNDDGLFYE